MIMSIQQNSEAVANWHKFAEQVNVEAKLRDVIGETLVILQNLNRTYIWINLKIF